MRVAFIHPAEPGIDGYTARMMAALAAEGVTVSAHAATSDELIASLDRPPADAALVIDDRLLPAPGALHGCADAIVARRGTALVHHRPTPEPDPAQAAWPALLPRLARVITTSDAMAAHLAGACGVDPARIAVVAAGAAPAARQPARAGGTCEILSVGPPMSGQGHDRLIEALARLFDLDWRLTIAGTPRDAALANAAASLGVARRVVFAGEVGGAALEALWQAADIFALASPFDADGVDVAAAMRRGLPVGVMAGGAATALVTPAAGVVCDAGDVVTFSKALRRVIFDTALRAAMAEAAWQIGQNLPGWDTQARAFAAALG